MSLSVELTGLQAAQTDLDTIGNNIANVGTVGFKGSTPNFSDIYGASLLGSAGTGVSPGQGVSTNSLSQLFTEGTISQTGNPMDVAINGNGFFQVSTPSGIAYTRDGSLQMNSQGYLTNDTGALIMGYAPTSASTTAPSSGASTGALGTIQISEANIPATATSSLTLNVSLPSTDAAIDTTATPFNVNNSASYSQSTTTAVYDSLGTPDTLTTYFTKVSGSGTPDNWQTHWELSNSSGSMIASGSGATLAFNSSGELTAGSGTITVANPGDGAGALSIAQGFAGTTLSDLAFGVNSITNNGNGAGQFSGLEIGNNGDVVAQYSNGATKTMGTIALANFVNPNGLSPISGNAWVATEASGPAADNTPGAAGLGTLESGSLETSNVDLSTSLVNLIVAQQAYQANVQGINVDQQDVQKLLQLQ
ncbi:MAG TPA: flagellar hook protein FlgE [Stellaceae bacterium]|nr:flagellar hook protein FlgE [Stellaceae bacterium]